MFRLQERPQATDCERLAAGIAQFGDRGARLVFIEFDDDLAKTVDPFGDATDQPFRDQGVRFAAFRNMYDELDILAGQAA